MGDHERKFIIGDPTKCENCPKNDGRARRVLVGQALSRLRRGQLVRSAVGEVDFWGRVSSWSRCIACQGVACGNIPQENWHMEIRQ